MKVGTDSILLGSFVNHRLSQSSTPTAPHKAVDVGSGSGLLALMLAQWSQGQLQITAVDIDATACEQARSNVARSPWPDSITVVNQDARQWLAEQPMQYDIIISNPPYFNSIQSPSRGFNGYFANRQQARSQMSLDLSELALGLQQGLASAGKAFVILPAPVRDEWVSLLQQRELFVAQQLDIASVVNKPVSRYVFEITKEPQSTVQQQINVYTADHVYTDEYRQLCRAFYLNF